MKLFYYGSSAAILHPRLRWSICVGCEQCAGQYSNEKKLIHDNIMYFSSLCVSSDNKELFALSGLIFRADRAKKFVHYERSIRLASTSASSCRWREGVGSFETFLLHLQIKSGDDYYSCPQRYRPLPLRQQTMLQCYQRVLCALHSHCEWHCP